MSTKLKNKAPSLKYSGIQTDSRVAFQQISQTSPMKKSKHLYLAQNLYFD
jgi:hypothetical protein